MKRPTLASLVLLLLLLTNSASARELQQGDACTIPAERTVTGTLFVFCRTLVLDGRVEGSLIGIATNATLNGSVAGDVYLIAAQLDVKGTLGEDLYFAGATLRLHEGARFSGARADLISLALSVRLGRGVDLSGSVLSVGYQLLLDGGVDGEVSFWGSALVLNGVVARSVDASVGAGESQGAQQLEALLFPLGLELRLTAPGLVVGKDARLLGALNYTAPAPGRFLGRMKLAPVYTPILAPVVISDQNALQGFGLFVAQALREFVTLGIIGVVWLLLAPRSTQAPIASLQTRPVSILSVGLLAFFMVLLALFGLLILCALILLSVSLLRITEVLIATVIVLVVLTLSVGSLALFVAIFLSRVVVGMALGRGILRMFRPGDGGKRDQFGSMAAGVGLLTVLGSLPEGGWVFNALALFMGLGALLNVWLGRLSAARSEDAGPRAPAAVIISAPETPRLPPPLPDERMGTPRGMENLPPGFTWWDD